MDMLQSKADDIENITETSLDRQKQLVDSQNAALEVLQTLTSFQSQALEESRGTLQQLIELGHIFESKQASMFLAIESQVIKAFLVYSILIFTLYMFTSTKQTYNIRPKLYIGLYATFFVEFVVLRYGNDVEKQAWIISIVIYGCFRAVTRFKLNKTNKESFLQQFGLSPSATNKRAIGSVGIMSCVGCTSLYYLDNSIFQINWKDDEPYSNDQLERCVNSWVNSFGNKHLSRQKGKMVIYSIQKVTFTPFLW
ncbi:hypothetical protein LXL04_024909 [Taraxacum kok-saghyz]